MPKTHAPYAPEYRQQILELARSGRSAEELSNEFEPTAQCIHNWIKQDEVVRDQRQDGLTSEERAGLVRLRRENKQLKLEREILAHRPDALRGKPQPGSLGRPTRSHPGLRVRERQPGCLSDPQREPCVAPGRHGFYAWRKRPPSKREQEDKTLTQEIKKIHQKSKGTYGAPRIHAELAEQGLHVGRKRVARLMCAADLRGVSRRKAPRTTRRSPEAQPAPDLVQRNFTASRPNELWVADTPALACGASVTYIPTWAGFLYLAVVLDAWSRRVVGWAIATHLRTEPGLQALQTPALRAGAVWLSSNAILRMSSTIPIIAVSTPPLPLVTAAGKRASVPPWARSVIAEFTLSEVEGTMPCVKASSPLSNANCSIAPASAPRLKRTQSFFSLSKVGTIRIVVTRRSTISHPTGTKPFMLVPHDPKSLPVH